MRFRQQRFWSLILHLALIAGCASSSRVGSSIDSRDYDQPIREFSGRNIKTIGIIRPDFDVYHITKGGIRDYRYDWSTSTSAHIRKSVREMLMARGYTVGIVDSSAASEHARDLMSWVGGAARRHLFGPESFGNDLDELTYTVGPVTDLDDTLSYDAILLVAGVREELSEQRREVLKSQTVMKNVRSGFLSVITGTMMVYQVPKERVMALYMMVDRSGDLVWFEMHGKAIDGDFTDYRDVVSFTDETVRKVPQAPK